MFKTISLIFLSIISMLRIVWQGVREGHRRILSKRTNSQQRLQRQVSQLITAHKGWAWLCQWRPSSPTYRRPWLLFIGAPHSGKTSTIRQIFSPMTHLQNQGADLFQARQAVCIEMTTQPKQQQKSSFQAWHYLLSMVRRYRRRQPLDALVWVVALPEVLIQCETKWLAQIKQGQRRLMAIKQAVKKNVPVYLLFTKLDGVNHFETFAQHIRLLHPLGFHVHCSDDAQTSPQQQVAQQLECLYQSLLQQRMQGWQAVTRLDEQLAIYDFPEQFNQARQRLQSWFELWFANACDGTLAGIFFSACPGERQSMITRSLWNQTAAFLSIEPMTNVNVVPNDSWTLANYQWLRSSQTIAAWGGSLARYRQKTWPRYTLIGVGFLLSGIWMHSVYQTVKTFLVEINQTLQTVDQINATTLTLLSKTLIRHQQLMTQRQQRRWYQSLGFWHTQILEQRLTRAIMNKLQTTVLQNLPQQLISALAAHHRQWATLSFDQKVLQYPMYAAYFNLDQWLHHPSLRQSTLTPGLMLALKQTWATHSYVWPSQALRYVLEHYPSEPLPIRTAPDIFLLQQVQTDLQPMAWQPAARYQLLRQEWSSLNEATTTANNQSLPSFFYTAAGWRQWVQPRLIQMLHDPWLAHLSSAQRQRLGRQILTHYVADLRQQWRHGLLDEAWVEMPQTFESWLDQVGIELNVQKHRKVYIDELNRQFLEFVKLMKQPKSAWDSALADELQQPITTWRALIRQLQQPALWHDSYAQLLQPLLELIAQWRAHPQPSQFAFQQIQQMQLKAQPLPWQQAQQQLKILTQKNTQVDTQQIIYQLLMKPIEQVQQWMVQQAQQFITQQWQVEVLDYYQQKIAGRFPFTAATTPDAPDLSLKQLTQFLQPEEGLVWRFYQHYYEPFQSLLSVDPKWQSLMGQLKQISELFFNGAASTPQLDLEVLPIPNPQLQELRWVHGQQQWRYQNEPQQWRALTWPPQGAPLVTLLSGRLLNEHWIHHGSFDGVWGFFRLLAMATMTSMDDQTLQVRWNLAMGQASPLTVTLLLRTSDQAQAFVSLLTTRWQFPATVFSPSPPG